MYEHTNITEPKPGRRVEEGCVRCEGHRGRVRVFVAQAGTNGGLREIGGRARALRPCR